MFQLDSHSVVIHLLTFLPAQISRQQISNYDTTHWRINNLNHHSDREDLRNRPQHSFRQTDRHCRYDVTPEKSLLCGCHTVCVFLAFLFNFNVMSVEERHEETFSLRTERLTIEAFKFLLTFEQIVFAKSHRVLVSYLHDVVSH